jgi:hypothetical protein
VRGSERAGHEPRVLGVAEDGAATDATGADDHAVARLGAIADAGREHAGTKGRERSRVAEELEALVRGERSGLPLWRGKRHLKLLTQEPPERHQPVSELKLLTWESLERHQPVSELKLLTFT